MKNARAVIRRDAVAASARPPIDTVTLDRQARFRRRIVMTTDQGAELLLDLPEATYIAEGDAFVLANGDLVAVKAAPEELMEIRARDPHHLMRIAWHLGNRHTPTELADGALYIQTDHVLADMVAGLGGEVRAVLRPFEPEGGAYGGHGPLHSGHHHHGHAHDHGDHHHHDHDHAHEHPPTTRVWRPA